MYVILSLCGPRLPIPVLPTMHSTTPAGRRCRAIIKEAGNKVSKTIEHGGEYGLYIYIYIYRDANGSTYKEETKNISSSIDSTRQYSAILNKLDKQRKHMFETNIHKTKPRNPDYGLATIMKKEHVVWQQP